MGRLRCMRYAGLRMAGAVRGPLLAVGGDTLLGTGQATLFIAQGSLEAIPQDVEAGAVLVGCNGVGHSVTFGAVEAVVCAHGQRGSHPAFTHGRTKD
jgi:hypothetical protein